MNDDKIWQKLSDEIAKLTKNLSAGPSELTNALGEAISRNNCIRNIVKLQ